MTARIISTDPYDDFIARKGVAAPICGLTKTPALPSVLKPFQRDLVIWALHRGRAAIFANTGLGKTIMELAWADAMAKHTGHPVPIFTPLAVAQQTVEEAAKFGIEGVGYARNAAEARGWRIPVSNYERFDKFDMGEFQAGTFDESSILKSHDGKTRAALTEACQVLPYRLACTATPAPNDFVELGNHAEFLGIGSQKEMLSMFFVHDGSVRAGGEEGEGGWRLKGHAQRDFWAWVSSWGAFVRHPRDLGYDEPGYDLPPLRYHQVTVPVEYAPSDGMLFPMEARTMSERLGARRTSIPQRVQAAVSLVGTTVACGSKNITSARSRDTAPIQNIAPRSEPHAERPRKTSSICEPTTGPTKESGKLRSLSSNEMSATQSAENNMLVTPHCEHKSRRTTRNTLPPDINAANGSSENSASPKSNTQRFCGSKKADALFAVSPKPTQGDTDCTSTIATQQDSSGDCSAHHATSELENSGIIPTSSIAPSNTFWRPAEPWTIWCGLNSEQDALAAAFGDSCISIYGSLDPDEKVDRLRRWLCGERPILISKISICGFGINMQHCRRMIFVGMSDSFEGFYQAVRRCWRFGQTAPVDVYMIASELEGAVVANIRRKEAQHEAMGAALAEFTRDLTMAYLRGSNTRAKAQVFKTRMEMPAWL